MLILDKFDQKASYELAQKKFWVGRSSNPDMGNQYWHQEIRLESLLALANTAPIDIAILGYVCDTGVQRNLGRIGAAGGPEGLRERLAKLPIHFNHKQVADVGDIICLNEEMEACQALYADAIATLLDAKIFPIAIGGGHDMAYGTYKGIKKSLDKGGTNRVGIINFDAHFDLRPVEQEANSGTPFNQLIQEAKKRGEALDYFAIGIQRQSNTKELFDIAASENVNFAINYDCESATEDILQLQKRLLPFIANNDFIYVTIDMDGFSSAYAPGVSAPSPLGFTPFFVFKMLSFLFKTNKVIACDIAELNPSLDRDSLTANLAAKLVDFIVMIRDAERRSE